MPKRNRHREQLKSTARAGTPPVQPAQPVTASNAPATKSAPKVPRPPTPPADPAKRRAKARLKEHRYRARLKLQVPAVMDALQARWPAAFPKEPALLRPWAIGLLEDLVRQNVGYSKSLLKVTLKRFTKREEYQVALAAGGSRYDLEGNPKGEVTEEQKAKAVEKLKELREKAVRTTAGGLQG